jgi:hypothetical protein
LKLNGQRWGLKVLTLWMTLDTLTKVLDRGSLSLAFLHFVLSLLCWVGVQVSFFHLQTFVHSICTIFNFSHPSPPPWVPTPPGRICSALLLRPVIVNENGRKVTAKKRQGNNGEMIETFCILTVVTATLLFMALKLIQPAT